MSSATEPNFKAFSKITVFMRELKEAFGTEFPELAKYYQLCKRTGLDNHALIERQIGLFGKYCKANSEAIQTGQLDALNGDNIEFNDKIKFNLKAIVEKADETSRKVILKYLQLILCLIYPDDKLKNQLVAQAQEEKKVSPEEDMFASILSKVEDRYKDKPPTDLGSTIADMQSSGFMQDLAASVTQGLDSGELDLTNLMRGAFGMFNKIKAEANDPQISGMLGMVESMINTCKSTMNLDDQQ